MLDPWIIEKIRRREEERRRQEERRIEVPIDRPQERPPQEQTDEEEKKPWEPTEIDIGGGNDDSESKSRITQIDMMLI